jgi:LacI family transcriptional regulator
MVIEKIHGRTTIRDVSRLADVSVATVSAVINGKPAVSETLTQRVRRAIEALNYQPDYLARSLRMQRSNILGIVMPQFASPYYAEVLRGVEDVASEHGYSIFVSNSRGNAEQERKEIFVLVSRRVDGILLATADSHFAYQRQFSQRFPLVLFDRFPPAFTGTVVATDNAEASFEATNHLIRLGHLRIAMIAGTRGISAADERVEGFRRAMNEAGLTLTAHGNFFTQLRDDARLDASACRNGRALPATSERAWLRRFCDRHGWVQLGHNVFSQAHLCRAAEL